MILVTSIACGDDGGNVDPADSGVVAPPQDASTTPPGMDASTPMTDTGPSMCIDLTVFEDTDDDGYGVDTSTERACLAADEEKPGYARTPGDCKPDDPLAYPTSGGVCGDFVDDNCDGVDEPCPTTQTAALDVPSWDCLNGAPPSNVYAWSLFSSGGGYYQDNGCFIFFEGLPNEFYAIHTMTPVNQDPGCFGRYGGCICPSTPSYDKRIMAYTLMGTVDTCEEISIIDHGGISCTECFDQPTSNDCRKYLYAMHDFFDIPYSFVGNEATTIQRLERFPTIELACVNNPPNTGLTYFTLLTSPIQLNSGFVKK